MKPTGKALQVRKTTLPVARPSIALALGGGGARGLAHILMLEVFDELGLKPTIIAGTSVGAVFGAAYASGLSARLSINRTISPELVSCSISEGSASMIR